MLSIGLESAGLTAVSIALFAASIVLLFLTNRCPHCGAFFRGLAWSAPHRGYCSKCGKMMEFDDTEEG